MWKKALWVYLAVYVLGVVILVVNDAIADIREGGFDPISLLLPLLLLVPAAVLALGLRGKKISIVAIVFGLLIVAVPLMGVFRFNPMSIATIGKALLFVPLLVGLVYFGYERLFGKTQLSRKT